MKVDAQKHENEIFVQPKSGKINYEYVLLNSKGEISQRGNAVTQQLVEELGNGVGLELIKIPKGFFQMGSLRSEGGYDDEHPLHPVFVNSFWMGKHPILQAQWQAVMGKLPECRFKGHDLPVENITWQEAVSFCNQLSSQTKRQYTLPSEAMWEYACKAGTNTPFSYGETITTDYVNYVGIHTFRDEVPGIYRHGTTPAGTFPPNRWGLFDMHGNVWEFCQDGWTADYTGLGIDSNAHGGDKNFKVARGGSWHETPFHCRSAMRLRVIQNERLEFYGMRVMLEYQEQEN